MDWIAVGVFILGISALCAGYLLYRVIVYRHPEYKDVSIEGGENHIVSVIVELEMFAQSNRPLHIFQFVGYNRTNPDQSEAIYRVNPQHWLIFSAELQRLQQTYQFEVRELNLVQ